MLPQLNLHCCREGLLTAILNKAIRGGDGDHPKGPRISFGLDVEVVLAVDRPEGESSRQGVVLSLITNIKKLIGSHLDTVLAGAVAHQIGSQGDGS